MVGCGAIGQAAAARAAAFGMRVIGADVLDGRPPGPIERVELDELLAAADVISLHATLDAHSRGLLGAQALAACKPGAVVVNTARGGLIDTTALLAALDAGAIAGAALDVLDPEPPDAATCEGLVRHPRVILTPHAAWYSEESFVQLKTEVAREAVRRPAGRTAALAGERAAAGGGAMRALTWAGGHDVVVADVPEPEPGPDQVLVAVGYTGLCGTDLHICAGEHPRAKPGVVIGHEIAGTVAATAHGFEAGTAVVVDPLVACGRCATCRSGRPHTCENLRLIGIDSPGGAAPLVAVDADRLIPVPGSPDLRHLAFAEPLAVAVRAVRRSGLQLGQTVAVVGGGPIGVAVALCARNAGAGRVVLAEPAPARREFAAGLAWRPWRRPRAFRPRSSSTPPGTPPWPRSSPTWPPPAARWWWSRSTATRRRWTCGRSPSRS